MLQQFNPRNRDLIVNINGRLVHRDEAGVSPFDSAVQNGDAVWEGLRLYEGGVFKLREHLQRLQESARMLSYAEIPSVDTLTTELRRTLEANAMWSDVHVRLTVSRGLKYTSGLDPRINNQGPSIFVLAEHKPLVYDKQGITLVVARHRRPPPHVLDQRIHSCNQLTSILAKLEANAAGADDALLLDTRGYLAETNATHVFIVTDGCLRTSTCVACPEGITRATVLQLCRRNDIRAVEQDVTLEQLFAADEMFCTGTMGELVPVTHLDEQPIGASGARPIFTQLCGLFEEEVRSACTPVVDRPA